MIYYYARVSSISQNLDRQVKLFKELGADDRDIFIEKKSGKDFNNRTEWQSLLRRLRTGDTIVVKNLDRVGRNAEEVRKVLIELSKKDIIIKSLEQEYLNDFINNNLNKSKEADSLAEAMLTAILDTMLQVDLLRAEWERKELKKRQKEGIQRAKEKGTRFGRTINTEFREKFNVYYPLTRDKDNPNYMTVKEARRLVGCSVGTFHKLSKEK